MFIDGQLEFLFRKSAQSSDQFKLAFEPGVLRGSRINSAIGWRSLSMRYWPRMAWL